MVYPEKIKNIDGKIIQDMDLKTHFITIEAAIKNKKEAQNIMTNLSDDSIFSSEIVETKN